MCVIVCRIDLEQVLCNLDCFLEFPGPEQRICQSAVRSNGPPLAGGVLSQLHGSASVLRHLEQQKAAQLPRVLVVRIDAQHSIGVFKGQIQLGRARRGISPRGATPLGPKAHAERDPVHGPRHPRRGQGRRGPA